MTARAEIRSAPSITERNSVRGQFRSGVNERLTRELYAWYLGMKHLNWRGAERAFTSAF